MWIALLHVQYREELVSSNQSLGTPDYTKLSARQSATTVLWLFVADRFIFNFDNGESNDFATVKDN